MVSQGKVGCYRKRDGSERWGYGAMSNVRGATGEGEKYRVGVAYRMWGEWKVRGEENSEYIISNVRGGRYIKLRGEGALQDVRVVKGERGEEHGE